MYYKNMTDEIHSGGDLPRLRGHHLICLHFFRGEGYDDRFIENLSRIVDEAEAGKPIMVHEGHDDVCNVCSYLNDGGCAYEEDAEIAIREMDADALMLLNARAGDVIRWRAIRARLGDIIPKWKELHCKNCVWLSACLKNPAF